ncbi:hypothetical protein [Haloarcula sp. CBA1129]|uniref:hypothetical protein n=1 Tax=Haloarcula sp. CBA1129 TaxID=1853684 RepID=UPI0017875B32|nr:hypothetical protein [Haloarcula sp. CBA1129]
MHSAVRIECHRTRNLIRSTRWNIDPVNVRNQTVTTLGTFEQGVSAWEVPDPRHGSEHWHRRRLVDVPDSSLLGQTTLQVHHS